jgi:uncharacterized cupredoxin-like copper-binding protein
VACSGDDDNTSTTDTQTPPSINPTVTGGAPETTVQVTEREYQIALEDANVEEGSVTFKVKNEGEMTHEFVVVKTDLKGDQLPQKEGVVDEDSSQLEVVDEIEDVAAGKTESLTADMSPGHYVLLCNISGHYQLGMHSDFEVSPASAQSPR